MCGSGRDACSAETPGGPTSEKTVSRSIRQPLFEKLHEGEFRFANSHVAPRFSQPDSGARSVSICLRCFNLDYRVESTGLTAGFPMGWSARKINFGM